MNKVPTTSCTDDATFVLVLIFAVIGTLAATAISVIIAMALLVVAWFFDQPRRTAFTALGIALVAAVAQPLVPGFLAFVAEMFASYQGAFQREHYLLAIGLTWLSFTLDPQAWWRLMPVGLLTGAMCLLAIETRKTSINEKVFGGEKAARPSPWARIMARKVLAGPTTFQDKIVLGVDKLSGKRITVSRRQTNLHVCIVGRSGRGKSESVLTMCCGAAHLDIPVVFIDGKGDPSVRRVLRKLAHEHGRPFYAFDTMNPATSCAWAVFADMNPTTQADVIVGLRQYTEPHYEGKAARFAGLTTKVLHHVSIDLDLFTLKESLSVDRLLALLRSKATKDDHVGRGLMKEVAALREIEAEAVDSLMPEIGRLTDTTFGFLFDVQRARRERRPILRLLQARRESAVVYIGLPALEYEKVAPKVGALACSSLKAILPALDREHEALTDEPLPLEAKQFFIVFDEWGVFTGDGKHVLNVINQGRSFGGSCCLAAQTFADCLVDGSDQLLRQIVGSTNTFIVHELTDPQDAEYAAGLFATQAAVEHTAQTVGGAPTGAASARATKQFVVHPDQIKNIGVGEAYYMNKNDKDRNSNKSIIRLIKVRKSTG